jgi:hypothetical protein
MTKAPAIIETITNEFVQIGDPIKFQYLIETKPYEPKTDPDPDAEPPIVGGPAVPAHLKQITSAVNSVRAIETTLVMDRVDTIIYCFGIADQLYQGLVGRYTSMTLTYPTQVLNIASMSNILKTNSNPKSSQTSTPRFIDTLFFLFPFKTTHHSVFKNPGFTNFYLTAGGFGQYPDIPYGTKGDPRFVEMIQNAINLNTNSVAPNEEVLNSIMDSGAGSMAADEGQVSEDCTSFFIAIPLETDGTFQQGQTSATPVNYELHIQQDENSGYSKGVQASPLICCLQDATISVQVMADGSPPLVEVGPFDITSPVAG